MKSMLILCKNKEVINHVVSHVSPCYIIGCPPACQQISENLAPPTKSWIRPGADPGGGQGGLGPPLHPKKPSQI